MSQPQPYVGPKPFAFEDQKFFFGRDREENDLLALIQAHPVVVLYAQSGAGKTSLLEAKLVPALYGLKAEVFRGVRVGGHLPPGIDTNQVSNVFVFNAVMTLRPNPGDAHQLTQTTLPEAFGVAQKVPPVVASNPASAKVVKLEVEPLRVAIFDQFEEIFTSHPQRWADRKGFFEQVAKALQGDPFLHVVFAIREEYLGSLLPHANDVPGRLRVGLRLERLRRESALEAVVNPLRETERSFAPRAAELLVDNLLSNAEFIEPLHLQVVCRNLWQSLEPATKIITTDSIQSYGDLDTALGGYYEECIAKTVTAKKIGEATLRNWFGNELILPGNKRNLVYQDQETTAGLANDVVKLLDEQHLIRGELRGGLLWYEIAHDRFVRPIVDSNWLWQQINDTVGFSLLEAAQQWVAAKRSSELLLEGPELSKAREWREGPGAEIWRAGGLVHDLIEASENRDIRRHARSRLIQVAGVLSALVFVVMLFWRKAYQAEQAANKQREIAEYLRMQAEQTKLAERGLFASSLVQSQVKRPRQLDALVWGIKAMGPAIGEGLRQSPSPDARKGLEDALRPLGDVVLFSTAPKSTLQFFSDNRILASSSEQIDAFNTTNGALLWRRLPNQNLNYVEAVVSPDSTHVLITESPKQSVSSKPGGNLAQESLESKQMAEKRLWLSDAMTGAPVDSSALFELKGGFFDWTGSRIVAWKELPQDQYRIRISNVNKQQTAREIDIASWKYLTISPDGILACLLADGTLKFWNTSDQSPAHATKLEYASKTDWPMIQFSPDGRRLVVAPKEIEQPVKIFDPAAREIASSREPFAASFICFSADSRTLAVLTSKKIVLVDSGTGETRAAYDFGDNYNRFVSAGLTRALCIRLSENEQTKLTSIDLNAGTITELPVQPFPGVRCTVSENLDWVATIDQEGIGRVFNVSKPPVDLATMPDRELLALACRQLSRIRPQRGDALDSEVTSICLDTPRG